MPRDKEGAQRKVFMLPTELVERVAAYQARTGLSSEVEAVRRLLSDALRMRDDWRSITDQVVDRMKRSEPLVDAAKDVVVGHPAVATVSFEPRQVVFQMLTGETLQISESGDVTGEHGNQKLNYPGF
ncbi:hypothetical protein [Mesorhizobium sp.]|uniref:hypothetical protein n=1 Tax=Mesorhizobium sp. TaxID=1871066 RepID=UPI000FE731CD|nr:hypothetical protein [Mesorhizobium sp.]RWQ54346.1 MAG: hypothetical protein EOS84_13650 [Mesorhizobium sp.]